MSRWHFFYDMAAAQLAVQFAGLRSLSSEEKEAAARRMAGEARMFADAFFAASGGPKAPSVSGFGHGMDLIMDAATPLFDKFGSAINSGETLRPSPEQQKPNPQSIEKETK